MHASTARRVTSVTRAHTARSPTTPNLCVQRVHTAQKAPSMRISTCVLSAHLTMLQVDTYMLYGGIGSVYFLCKCP